MSVKVKNKFYNEPLKNCLTRKNLKMKIKKNTLFLKFLHMDVIKMIKKHHFFLILADIPPVCVGLPLFSSFLKNEISETFQRFPLFQLDNT